jgi:hypothetical protein
VETYENGDIKITPPKDNVDYLIYVTDGEIKDFIRATKEEYEGIEKGTLLKLWKLIDILDCSNHDVSLKAKITDNVLDDKSDGNLLSLIVKQDANFPVNGIINQEVTTMEEKKLDLPEEISLKDLVYAEGKKYLDAMETKPALDLPEEITLKDLEKQDEIALKNLEHKEEDGEDEEEKVINAGKNLVNIGKDLLNSVRGEDMNPEQLQALMNQAIGTYVEMLKILMGVFTNGIEEELNMMVNDEKSTKEDVVEEVKYLCNDFLGTVSTDNKDLMTILCSLINNSVDNISKDTL